MSHMLIDYYKAIEDSSAKMLQAAQSKDWDGVVRYEGTCAVLIEQLRNQSQRQELLPEHRRDQRLDLVVAAAPRVGVAVEVAGPAPHQRGRRRRGQERAPPQEGELQVALRLIHAQQVARPR